ncbi:pyridoxamine 5'-phosphate oxidase family protein [Gilvibacter sediminis]|uniref:pyridoxamine 5'-phosphate oxidase family protein n=1 Tax=Gilvibacter sediminis TaxID=379071 RepID=UPI00234FE9DD|nr:pyridoxamine 5'-phosphate oxidase family protein [Gilvibacter sediminis]MDC7998153.1 pyridoxamine 5'-phosphate oxidase family protein [Gilvibacter sediminis]
MAAQFEELREVHKNFIEAQPIFFVATAAAEGRINLSPKGMDSMRVLDDKSVLWMNLTGSGNETAAHLLKSNRMTIMFNAFEDPPLILRLYGSCEIYHPRDDEFQEYIKLFPETKGARQLIKLHIKTVQTSCGYGVPYMDFKAHRTRLAEWAQAKTDEELWDYWEKKNQKSIDGFETAIFAEE